MSHLDVDRIFDRIPSDVVDFVNRTDPIMIHELMSLSEEELSNLAGVIDSESIYANQNCTVTTGQRRLCSAIMAYADKVEPAKYEELVYKDFVELREKVKAIVLKYKDPDACARAVSASVDVPFTLTVSKAANIYSVLGDPVVFYTDRVYTTFYDYIMSGCCNCVAGDYGCTFKDKLLVLTGVLSRGRSRAPYIHTCTIIADPRIVSSTDSLNQHSINKEYVREIQYEYRNNDLHYMGVHDTPAHLNMRLKFEHVTPDSDVWDFSFD